MTPSVRLQCLPVPAFFQARYAPVAYLLSDCTASLSSETSAAVPLTISTPSGEEGEGGDLQPSASEEVRSQRRKNRRAAVEAEAAEAGEAEAAGGAGEESGKGLQRAEDERAAIASISQLSLRSSKRLAELVTAQVRRGRPCECGTARSMVAGGWWLMVGGWVCGCDGGWQPDQRCAVRAEHM